jgi:amino acid permease
MVLLPGLFAGAGFTFPFVVTVLIAVLSSLSVLFLAKTIQSIPGNSGFSQRVEFSKLIRRLFPKWLYACAFFAMIFNLQVCSCCDVSSMYDVIEYSMLLSLYLCSQAANIGAIIVSAQTMDSTLLAIFKKTCAMTVFSPSWTSIGAPANAGIVDRNGTSPSPIFQCILNDNNDVNTDSPFGADYVISMGFLIVLVLCVPLGYFNLEDNIWVQQFGFFFLVLCLIAWVFQFFYSGMDVNRLGVLVPRPGTTTAFGSVLSVIIFQFNFALYVPSWLIEKRPDVSVGKSVFWAVVISSAMFLVLGILGALAYDYPAGQDFLAVLSSQSTSKQMLPTSQAFQWHQSSFATT